jgi:hypothetical protein
MHGPDERYAVRGDEVAAKSFDGEVVVVHLGTCTYYSASGSGADAWTWIEEGRKLGDVAAAIAERYDIDADRARRDLTPFVARLLEEGLIAPANDDGWDDGMSMPSAFTVTPRRHESGGAGRSRTFISRSR